MVWNRNIVASTIVTACLFSPLLGLAEDTTPTSNNPATKQASPAQPTPSASQPAYNANTPAYSATKPAYSATKPASSAVKPLPSAATLPYLNALLWQQYSAEHDAICLQTYNVALTNIENKIAHGGFTRRDGRLYEEIRVSQPDGSITPYVRPVAIVLDLDETVLSSNALMCWLSSGYNFKPDDMDSIYFYQAEQQVPDTVPGAIDFLRRCQELGVVPIYITDREEMYRTPTLTALRHAGLDCPDLDKHLFCRDDARDKAQALDVAQKLGLDESNSLYQQLFNTTSNKAYRRFIVDAKYKVLAYFGDDLDDSPIAMEKNTQLINPAVKRKEQVMQNARHFGRDWFVLPNTIYGHWKNTCGFAQLDHARALEAIKSTGEKYEEWLRRHERAALQ